MSFYEHFSEAERAILEERARRIAGANRADDQSEKISLLLVEVQGEQYAIAIAPLMAVYEGMKIVPVPCVPPYVSGVANIRGRTLPVLDLAVLLGLPKLIDADHGALVIVTNNNLTVALQVSTIGEIRTLKLDQLQSVPTNFDVTQARYVSGILIDGTPYIDLQHLLNDPAIIVDETLG